MRVAALVAVLLVAGCSTGSRRTPRGIPPEATYSTGAAVAGVAGIAASAAGSEMTRSERSVRTRKAGNAGSVAGAVLMGFAVADAIRVEREIRKLYAIYDFMIRQARGSPGGDDPFDPPPAAPAPTFEFVEDPTRDAPVRP